MLFALLVAVLSVLLGAALSFVPGTSRGLLGYMRTFATLAAVAVVVTHLLPEALRALGPLAILLFLGGWFAPALAHFIGQRSTAGRPANAVLEAGYWGLVAHHVADGIGLGTYSRLPASSGGHFDVIVALAAHTVPLIAVISLAYRSTFGARSALLRSLGLALASVLGIALSSLVAARTIEGFAPIIAAIAAGLLLHVVTHDLTEDPPLTGLARTLDLGAAALGVAVSWLAIDRNADPATWQFAAHVVTLANRAALLSLFSVLGLVAILSEPRGRAYVRRSRSVETRLLSFFLLGWAAGAVRAVLTAVARVIVRESRAPQPAENPGEGWYAHLTEALERLGPWLVLGFVVGALLASAPTSAWVLRFAGGLPELLLIVAVVNLMPVAAPAALLIAPGLSALGLSVGAVLLFVTLGPLLASPLDGRSVTLQRRASVSALCLATAALSNHFGVRLTPLDRASGTVSSIPMLALAAVLLFGVWQRGARIWLSSIVKTPAHEHEHAHDVHGPHEH